MEEKKSRKCVVKSKEYNNSYLQGVAMYVRPEKAEIFDYDKLPKHLKNSTRDEVILLDTKEGLEFLVNQIKNIDGQLPPLKYEVSFLESAREKFYNANPEMVSEYIKEHNQKIHPIIGISKVKNKKNQLLKKLFLKKINYFFTLTNL